MNMTATLDLASQVNILAIDSERNMALVMDEDGGEMEVSMNRLDNIEEEVLDLSPLEWWEKKNKKTFDKRLTFPFASTYCITWTIN